MFDLGNRFGGVQAFRADLGAIHDRMAAIQLEWVFQIIEALAGGFVAAID